MPFKPFNCPMPWGNKFYDRPVGREPCFHVNVRNDIHIVQVGQWNRYIYSAVMNIGDMRLLASSVNKVKLKFTGAYGGSFSINEYGIVIVPVWDDVTGAGYSLYAIGRWTGDMYFLDGAGNSFFLGAKFSLGVPWSYPYLGMKYHLSRKNRIYRLLNTNDGQQADFLPSPGYDSLVRAIRSIRPYGEMTFLVNPAGIVLAKRRGTFQAVYVCKLYYGLWFPDPLTGTRTGP